MTRRRVFITGATGTMGLATLNEFAASPDRFALTVLARDSRRNRRQLAPFMRMPGFRVIWGDVMSAADVADGVADADTVIHMAAVIPPLSDHRPDLAMKVNVGSTRIIVDALKARSDGGDGASLVFIGSVAQYGPRNPDAHICRAGDPMCISEFDMYGLSKVMAERIVAESGLRRWVSLRQSGILHKGLLLKGNDPLTFQVPLKGVLEWTTLEDSARLMLNVCGDTDDSFWRKFYNISSGSTFRMTNYDFECRLLKAIHCPAPERIFEPNWFSTRNFHGVWYTDADELENQMHFRSGLTAEEYFRNLSESLPWWMSLAPLAPPFIIKAAMRRIACSPDGGTLGWIRKGDEGRVRAHFGSLALWKRIPGWDGIDTAPPSSSARGLDHGYDDSKPDSAITLDDARDAARFRGGKCLSDSMEQGDLDTPLEWECACRHRFRARLRTVLRGGHWCPDCLPDLWKLYREGNDTPFFRQVIGAEK